MEKETLQEIFTWLMEGGIRVLAAGLLLLVGFQFIKWTRKGIGKSMEKAGLEITLRKFLDALIYAVSLGLLIFVAAEWVGIKMTSIVAMVGAAGLALSLSLQNTLANFAGGCLILFLKPFKVGDYIVTQDGEGTVESIGLVYTTVMPLDNRKIIIPNSLLSGQTVVNLSNSEKRRLVLDISLSYSSDLRRAKEAIKELFEASPLILKEEEVNVVVKDLADSGIILSARGWTRTENIWKAGWELREAIKYTFDEEGLEFAFPGMDIRIKDTLKRKELP